MTPNQPPAPSLSPAEQAELARGRALLDGLIRRVRQAQVRQAAASEPPARDERHCHD